ncbi:MAG: ATP-dependent DNA helicase, partial [Methanobrevibacter sp.]|nr:ATP-dependent DNA helicase [Methanobrevibacter sp.]
MLKKNCVCGKYVADRTKKPYQKKANNKTNNTNNKVNNKAKNTAKGIYQYENRKPVTVSEELDVPIAEVYDIAEHDLPQEVIDRLKEEYPEIPEQIIENFPFEKPREGQLEII